MSGKRKLSVKELRETITHVRKGEFLYKEKEQKKIDFAKYNTAQINEIADVLETIRDIVDAADQRLQKIQAQRVQKVPGDLPHPQKTS
jgi:predicted house-cleaning noncanonical NTP pyrophosphatase (MazG superfamily)